MEKTDIELNAVVTVGLDLAKHVFQVHAVHAAGRVVMSRALRRKDVLAFFERLPSCLIGMAARLIIGLANWHVLAMTRG